MEQILLKKLLLMLAVCNLRCGFLYKAIVYSRVGIALFPGDERFREISAYGLLLTGAGDACRDVLSGMGAATRNRAYLEARLEMLGENEGSDVADRLRTYLTK